MFKYRVEVSTHQRLCFTTEPSDNYAETFRVFSILANALEDGYFIAIVEVKSSEKYLVDNKVKPRGERA